MDYARQGWQAIVEEVSTKRKRLTLSLSIPPSELYGATAIRGDLTVVEERQPDGEYEAKEYHLLRVHRVVSKAKG